MKEFKLNSPYKPLGDQPKAINSLADGINDGVKEQTLLGVTGSGKTFTMANVIEKVQKPTLVISHNKTLAAQLYEEFKEFFPDNAVEYFVSYYDYYQPEAYVPRTDTFIDKEASINDVKGKTVIIPNFDPIKIKQNGISYILNIETNEDNITFSINDKEQLPFINYIRTMNLTEIKILNEIFKVIDSFDDFYDYLKR